MLLYKINETITPCSAEEVFSAGAPKQGQYVAVLGPDEWAEKKELFSIGLDRDPAEGAIISTKAAQRAEKVLKMAASKAAAIRI